MAFIKKHHARITNLHVKDMKRNAGPYTPFGQGDAPIPAVLKLLSQNKWDIPANIEYQVRRSRRHDGGDGEMLPIL